MIKNSTRFEKKVEQVFWFILALLPIVLYLAEVQIGSYTANFEDYIFVTFSFVPFRELLNSVLIPVFNYQVTALTAYFSYILILEIYKMMFYVFVFVPRICAKLVDRMVA